MDTIPKSSKSKWWCKTAAIAWKILPMLGAGMTLNPPGALKDAGNLLDWLVTSPVHRSKGCTKLQQAAIGHFFYWGLTPFTKYVFSAGNLGSCNSLMLAWKVWHSHHHIHQSLAGRGLNDTTVSTGIACARVVPWRFTIDWWTALIRLECGQQLKRSWCQWCHGGNRTLAYFSYKWINILRHNKLCPRVNAGIIWHNVKSRWGAAQCPCSPRSHLSFWPCDSAHLPQCRVQICGLCDAMIGVSPLSNRLSVRDQWDARQWIACHP